MIQLSTITFYPIKACRGFDLNHTDVERMGIEHDRRLMVVTPEGEFLSQREHPKLALVTPSLSGGGITLSAPNFIPMRIALRLEGPVWPVNIWKSTGVHSIDQGDEAAAWFSDWLGVSVRLVHLARGFKRSLNPHYAANTDDHTGFADGYPILVISEESLQDLNSRLDAPLPMNRFRPNLVVKGGEPFAEDNWKRIRIGDVEMAVVKPCPRCVVTTIDQETLETSRQPLKTLNSYRKQAGGAMFGQNVIPLTDGRIEVDMVVEVIK